MRKRGYGYYHYGGYHGRSGSSTVLKVIIGVLAAVLGVVLLFFLLQENHLIFSADGLRLDLPFSGGKEPAPPENSEPLVIVSVPPRPTPMPSPTPEPERPFRAALLPRTALSDGTAGEKLAALGANAAVFDMKADDGSLGYVSGVELARQVGASAADPAVNAAIEALNGGEIYTVARVSCFRDDKVPYYDNNTALRTNAGNWRDAGGVRWMSPQSEAARRYVTGLCVELAGLGFDEILLDNSAYPTKGELGWIRTGERYDPGRFETVVTEFYAQVEEALAADYPEVRLSIRTDGETILAGRSEKSGQSTAALVRSGDRIWADLGERAPADVLRALTDAGAENVEGLLVPVGRPESGAEHWALLE